MNKTQIVYSLLKTHQDCFLSITDLTKLSGLSYSQIQFIIARAYKIGWVKRRQTLMHKNGLNKNLEVYKTQYKITKLDSWNGLHDYYAEVLAREKGIELTLEERYLFKEPGKSIKTLLEEKQKALL